ncbi:hypothetical protein ACNTMW_02800 [Planosporangium sp. 12N6]|uniref:hypothetical protein n=1 Tax=Planosporangium spinosum TaxID=3402278 RepID=UPI003CF53672
MERSEHGPVSSTAVDPAEGRTIDPRSDEELRETREAQQAHGGSMAPGMVDATGHQVAQAPPTSSD